MSVAAVYVSTKTIDIEVEQFKAISEGHWITRTWVTIQKIYNHALFRR